MCRDADFLISSNDRTGQLLKYNPYTGNVYILYNDLAFPNGIACKQFVYSSEWINKKINLKFNMHDLKAVPKLFTELPNVLNNTKKNKNVEFWVTLNSEILGTIENGTPNPIKLKFNEEIKVLKILDGKVAPTFNLINEVKGYRGNYI